MSLRVEGLVAGYGEREVVHGIDLQVDTGEVVSVLGANGVGKSTLLRTLAGLIRPSAGKVELDGRDITRLSAHERVHKGLALVPEGQQSFPSMSVRENLELGARSVNRGSGTLAERLDSVIELFPRLGERSNQMAGTLSGGERQMLAIGRALLTEPQVLMLDEPSQGLAPIVIEQVADTIVRIGATTTILLVEQNLLVPSRCATRVVVLEGGRLTIEGEPQAVLSDDRVIQAYLGV
ncbi:ABC transporter ATP-binding protein [Cumulibacter soli]|uniref:ABC transporter ATP-binding protein n=1 Tax=Cumulibacter soli TaxID=2546344 RepID=UPI001068A3C0|nr:ABC transporter ATP-binding protein [Cumulibacter soli]